MRTIETLQAEHDAVLVVLNHGEQAAAAAARGVPVPADVFTDIQQFFAVFVDGCHHNKEEAAVFSRLSAENGGAALVDQLEADHSTGRQLARAFAAAVAAYQPGVAATGAAIEQALRAYGVMLRRHIDEENTTLFAAMEQSLSTADAEMHREFDRIEDEEIGNGVHEALHAMIDTLPARITPWLTASVS